VATRAAAAAAMSIRWPASARRRGDLVPRLDRGGGCCCADLLCLLRLSEIVIADPGRDLALRAMVDELVRLARVQRSLVAVPKEADGWRLSYLAHRGVPGRTAHRVFSEAPSEGSRAALVERRVVALPEAAESGHDGGGGSVAVPILAAERPLGVLEVVLRAGVPVEPWDGELFCAAAEFVALALLGAPPAAADVAGGEPRLTRRQHDVLFELVEHGAGNGQIGRALGLSARTVKIHLQAAYRVLGVRSRGEAIRLMLTRHPEWLSRQRQRRQDRASAP
jgi:DNA-binding CsgD family transcriptional regulator